MWKRRAGWAFALLLFMPAARGDGGLASGLVQTISGELVLTPPEGEPTTSVEAQVTYSHATRTGTVSLEIRSGGTAIADASAHLTADTQESAAAAVTALILTAMDALPGDLCRLLCLSDSRFRGDQELRSHASEIMDWWDAQGHAAYAAAYPNLRTHLGGRLQFNARSREHTVAVTLELSSPTAPLPLQVTGALLFPGPGAVSIVSGTLARPSPTAQYHTLQFRTSDDDGNNSTCRATLLLLPHQDGTLDVRGFVNSACDVDPDDVGSAPPFMNGPYTIEGIGNARLGEILGL
jgi:hypothetical protein